jgi:hypothetical protein
MRAQSKGSAMRLIDPRDFEGTARVRMLANVVAGGKPRAPGEVIEVPACEGYELICAGNAEPVVPAPAFVSLR